MTARRGPIDPKLLRRVGATRAYLVAGVAIGTLTAVCVVIQAWLLAQLVAQVFAGRPLHELPFGGLVAAMAALGAVIAVRATLAWLNGWLSHRAAAAVKSQLRSEIMAARVRDPHTQPMSTGSLIALMTQGLDGLDGYFSRYLPQLALAVTIPLIVGTAILFADWESALIVAVTLPLIPVFMILIGKVTEAKVTRRWRVQSRLAHHFGDLVAGLPTLQVFGRARAQEAGLVHTEARHRRETMATLRMSFLSSLVLELLATYSVALVAVPIGLRLVVGDLDLATGLFVLILVPEAYLPVRQVGVHYHDSADGVAAAEQAFAVIEGAPTAATAGGLPNPAGGVTLERVSFGYPAAPHPVLRELTFGVAPGEVVALTGPSGCGKSTVCALVMGFRRPTAGRVLIGATDLAELDSARWRARTAWVGQEPGMLSGTIADNVLLGDPDADRAAVVAALTEAGGAGLDPDRDVGDTGEGLSAGERRRVALARALLRIRAGAALLVLDEPTAGLDADTEAHVLAGVRRSGAAALVVTHRPAVIAAADRVVDLAGALR